MAWSQALLKYNWGTVWFHQSNNMINLGQVSSRPSSIDRSTENQTPTSPSGCNRFYRYYFCWVMPSVNMGSAGHWPDQMRLRKPTRLDLVSFICPWNISGKKRVKTKRTRNSVPAEFACKHLGTCVFEWNRSPKVMRGFWELYGTSECMRLYIFLSASPNCYSMMNI